SRRRVGPERLQQCRTQLQVVGADQDRGASNLVMLDQLTEQLGDELKIRGDSALGSDGGCRIAQLECEFTMLGQPGPLGQELRKQALALRALQSLEINGGRALGGQNGGSGGRTEMIMAVAMQRVRRALEPACKGFQRHPMHQTNLELVPTRVSTDCADSFGHQSQNPMAGPPSITLILPHFKSCGQNNFNLSLYKDKSCKSYGLCNSGSATARAQNSRGDAAATKRARVMTPPPDAEAEQQKPSNSKLAPSLPPWPKSMT